MAFLDEFCYDGSKKLDLSNVPTDSNGKKSDKDEIINKTQTNLLDISSLQDKLFAESKESILICIQALDAAGKDSIVKHVMSSINPQGIEVHGFKSPTPAEESHDFLWRYHRLLPSRGKMVIFNRSYYEETLVVKVHEFYKSYKIPDRTIKTGDYFEQKYDNIRNFEKYLYGNGFRIIKLFLNVSNDMQRQRFLERVERPEKNWKFSANDLKERQYWDKYQAAYEDAINNTSVPFAPWFVVPADQKWYTRYVVSEILLSVLKDINPQYPQMSDEARANLEKYKSELSK